MWRSNHKLCSECLHFFLWPELHLPNFSKINNFSVVDCYTNCILDSYCWKLWAIQYCKDRWELRWSSLQLADTDLYLDSWTCKYQFQNLCFWLIWGFEGHFSWVLRKNCRLEGWRMCLIFGKNMHKWRQSWLERGHIQSWIGPLREELRPQWWIFRGLSSINEC